MSQSIVDALRAKEAKMRQDLAEAQAAADAKAAAIPLRRRLRILLFLATAGLGAVGLLAWGLGASPLALVPAGLSLAAYAALRLKG